ncbi:hypothetical protein PENTCL1PPCAC_3398, partial [Pristionchus entomophagus]
ISSIITRSPQFIHDQIDRRPLLLLEVEHVPVDIIDVLLEYLDRVTVHHLLGLGCTSRLLPSLLQSRDEH